MENFLKSLPDNFEFHEFKIEKVLGQGGFGITYLARDMNLMQQVAIKEYFPREFSTRDSTFTIHAAGNVEDKETFAWGLKRFLDEARVLAQLRHPNIISIKRFFEAHGTAYLVMEYCDGKPLDEIIRDHGPLNESELNGILFPLMDGLAHVHEKAFLHRDIKPANIFIRRDGSPVLLDFGAAKHEMTSHSRSVTSLATAGYAPFEQYSTNGKQGTWSDIYGLAATIYRAISGVKPQDAPDRMLEDTLEPIADLLKGKFDPNLLTALDKSLAIRPDARPQTIEDLRNLIKKKPQLENPIKSTQHERLPSNFEKTAPLKIQPKSDYSKDVIYSKTLTAETNQANKKYFLLVIAIVVAFGIGWLISTRKSDSDDLIKSNNVSNVESKEAPVSATPLNTDTSPLPLERPEKSSSISPKPTPQEKKLTPQPLPTLSFTEVDLAISQRQLASAKILLKEIILTNPESALAYYRLGQISVEEGNYSDARQQLNKAKKIDPSLRFSGSDKFQELYNEIIAMEKMSKIPGKD